MSQIREPSRRSARIISLYFILAAVALVGVAHSAASLPEAAEQAAMTIQAGDLRAHVGLLASDELEGRGTGHRGNEIATLYLATVFERLRLAPAGDSYLQPVDLYFTRLGAGNELSVLGSGGDPRVRYQVGTDFQPDALSMAGTTEGPLAFAGYGVSAPEQGGDDYAGIDVRGRIVIVLEGGPARAGNGKPTGPRDRGVHGVEQKAAAARAHGAAGLLVVGTRLREPAAIWPDNPSVRARQFKRASRVDAVGLPVAWISSSAADTMLTASDGKRREDRRTAHLRRLLDQNGASPAGTDAPTSFTLDSRARLSVNLARERVVMHNVLGMIEGEDPRLRREVVVLGAHLDHDGIDDEGRIYNGSDDNASGTAAVLEAAEAFAAAAHAGRRPPRTVVFALWNGEEKGFLGSQAYLERPLPPGARIVAKLNLDMVGRSEHVPDPEDRRFTGLTKTSAADNANVLHVLGYSYSPDLAAVIRRENEAVGLTVKETLDESASHLIRRSDHWPFLQRQIPAVFLTTGLHPDYHTPNDDHAAIDFEKLERITRLAFRVAWRVASDPSVPRYRAPSRLSEAGQQ